MNSRIANIIAIGRVVHHLSPQNLNMLKLCILEQLRCRNESDFICKSLNSLYNNMTVESTTIIKKKAIELADSQAMKQSIGSDAHNFDCNVSVCKYIQQRYTDPLSRLHGDIIDYLGAFLNKKESIEFGYLNKQLFIETQKQSYLLKRCKDDVFILDDSKCFKLLSSQSNIFNYQFPQDLILNLSKKFEISKILNFNQFFSRLKSLTCKTLTSLSYIPVEIVFNMGSRTILKRLTIEAAADIVININQFCNNFNKYKNIICQGKNIDIDTNVSQLRWIETLEIDLSLVPFGFGDSLSQQKLTHRLVETLGNVCKSIYLKRGSLNINTMKQFQNIFHKNLEHFHLGLGTTITINPNIQNNTNFENDASNIDYIGCRTKLEHISIDSCYAASIERLDCLDPFFMRRFIKCYTIAWSPSDSLGYHDTTRKDNLYVFDKILFQDGDKHPLLEQIIIKYREKYDFTRFAKLLIYFNQHYKQLFTDRVLYLKHFKKIEIEFIQSDDVGSSWNLKDYTISNNVPPVENEKLFSQTIIDKKTIEIKNIKQGIKNFDIIYKIVFKWLKSLQDESDDGAIAMDGCKVVFLLQ